MVVELNYLSSLEVYVNDRVLRVANPDPKESLISLLRRHGLTGTKLGCAEGGCGSCTVMISYFDYSSKQVKHESANACLTPVCAVHLKHVITIEGIGSVKKLHPTQAAIAYNHGSQCGFCTPGIVMSLYTELKNNPNATEHDIEDAFDGNLCRCTGYRPILDGAKQMITGKCGKVCGDCNDECNRDIEDIYKKDIPFPQQLLHRHIANGDTVQSFVFQGDGVTWFHPNSLSQVLDIMDNHPGAKLIHGNTEVGIEVRFKNQKYPVYICTSDVLELKSTVVSDAGVSFGSATTVSSLQSQLKAYIKSLGPEKSRGLAALLENTKYFAGKQVRNVSAIGGNICTASPISDLNPVWVATDSILTVSSKTGGERQIPMREFFLGYRKTALAPTEIVVSIYTPFTSALQFVSAFKQAKRRDDDIAIVNAGLSLTLEDNNGLIYVKDGCFSFGGMGPTTTIAKRTLQAIRDRTFSVELINLASKSLLDDMPLPATAPGGQIQYRKTLVQSFFSKFIMQVSQELASKYGRHDLAIPERSLSGLQSIERGISSGFQVYSDSKDVGAVGKSIPHLSAIKQVTGEAQYLDDIPPFHNELYAVIVGTTIAHGYVKSIDASEALRAPGVVDFITASDIPGDSKHANLIGPIFKDEEIFVTKEVVHMGQMMGIMVAQSEKEARYAAKMVKIEYEPLKPVLTIEDAIESNSFLDLKRHLYSGVYSPDYQGETVPLSAATHHIEGTTRMAAQEHFYLEPNCTLVVPGKEDDELEVFSSTQHPTETQHLISHVLGIPSNRIVCRIKRMGGGFGGKESRSVILSCAAAIAARKLGVPIRYVLSREEDMALSGTRHPFLSNYKVGFTDEGKLIYAELDIYANAGCSFDLSHGVLERCIAHADNSYRIPNMKIDGRLCKTNIASNTAFRGFGGPQGMMIIEQAITHVADCLKRSVDEIRRLNLYNEGDVTPFQQRLSDVYLDRCWEEVWASSDYVNRKKAISEFNSKNKYRKRGIAIMPTKFGIAFGARHLNQAGALVLVYSDGSVKISHGGTEMGQGLHTKMIQVAATAFNIPISKIHLSETRTDTVANTSATAASASSDLNGMAVLNACEQIMERLKPIQDMLPDGTWEEIVHKAYFERINLCANGFYKTPDIGFDWATNKGQLYGYFTYGVAVCEVEIDTLTGDHSVLRADINMDIGSPINPAIDVGQIEGAFVQGLGWCTIEELLISPTTGFLVTRGPGMYKIPGFKDIPVDFRVTVMEGVKNSKAIHSSKAVGEPPLFMGASAFFALKDAISAARQENGLGSEYFRLDLPATSEKIRIACADGFVRAAETPLKPNERSWSVAA